MVACDIFGIPGKGAHRARIGKFAAVDTLMTAALAAGIAWLMTRRKQGIYYMPVTFMLIFIILILLSIIVHKITLRGCKNTALTEMVFPETRVFT